MIDFEKDGPSSMFSDSQSYDGAVENGVVKTQDNEDG